MRRTVRTRPTTKSALKSWTLIESLEDRSLMTVAAGAASGFDVVEAKPGLFYRPVATPVAVTSVDASDSSATFTPFAGSAVSGPYTPTQMRHAYGVDQLAYDGAGQTIAIVDAYDNPTVATDLANFSTRFGLPAADFTKATPYGTPSYNSGWSMEIALDVQWAHAIAPKAKILLVEATSASDTALLRAVDYAVAQGASVVSMSWGGGEFSGQSTYDSHFNKSGVTFLASAGDSGAEVEFPAVSPYVVGVGGTSISLDSAGNKLAETTWSGSGGAVSKITKIPSYQVGFQSGSYRGVPDVAYAADPNTGVYVNINGSYYAVGGTSAGAPQWAGIIALVNQARAANGLAAVGTGLTYGTNTALYNLAGKTSYTNANGDFFDVTTGSNGLPATVGYDNATGLGTPVANKLVADLAGNTTPTPTTPTVGDAGFEAVGVGSWYSYNPAGSPWQFAGYTGLTGNNNPFTAGNPAAPQGSQVAFLQMTGSFSQAIAGWAAGSYQISFAAARRGNYGGQQDFQVLVDNAVVGTFSPSSTSYATFTTGAFAVAAGSHTITFKGLDTVGGDATDFIDGVAVAAAGSSTNPAASGSGAVMAPAVSIPGVTTAAGSGLGSGARPTVVLGSTPKGPRVGSSRLVATRPTQTAGLTGAGSAA